MIEAQSKYGEVVAKPMHATVAPDSDSGFSAALNAAGKGLLDILWYGHDQGEPAALDVQSLICRIWNIEKAKVEQLFLVDNEDALVERITLRGVSGSLTLSESKPTERDSQFGGVVANSDDDESGSDEDEIGYDELPANVQGMSIFDQIAWKKKEVAKRRAERLARQGKDGGGKPKDEGTDSAGLLNAMLGNDDAFDVEENQDNGNVPSDDEPEPMPSFMAGLVNSSEDEDDTSEPAGLNQDVFSNLMAAAEKNSGERDFDSPTPSGDRSVREVVNPWEMDARPPEEQLVVSAYDHSEGESDRDSDAEEGAGDRSLRETANPWEMEDEPSSRPVARGSLRESSNPWEMDEIATDPSQLPASPQPSVPAPEPEPAESPRASSYLDTVSNYGAASEPAPEPAGGLSRAEQRGLGLISADFQTESDGPSGTLSHLLGAGTQSSHRSDSGQNHQLWCADCCSACRRAATEIRGNGGEAEARSTGRWRQPAYLPTSSH